MPEHIGHGYVELILFSNKMTLLIFNCKWKESHSFHIDEGDRIRLNFSLDLTMKMDLGEDDPLELSKPSWRLINHDEHSLVHEHIQADTSTVWVTVALTQCYIDSIMTSRCSSVQEQTILKQLFSKYTGDLIYQEFPLDHNLHLIVSNIISMNLTDSLHLTYAKCKADELICLALDRILQPKISLKTPVKLRKRDEDAIKFAQSIIQNNLAEVPSIRDICLMIGMNRNKFHYGFKALFNMPLNQYVKKERLNKAYYLLTHTDKTIADIATEVGFTHQSSFSTAFKAYYLINPKQLRYKNAR